ncbi:Retrovirus-related Pol polyprotein [Labeo rohita]|uniref:ribonuclease H n=1 Tax=Labeo rohita TaxID=84645 RepID=A0ABQ8MIB6_LABRO|nr:Retrovirus-related Pol polyprotein [Labeo rohita]
MDAELQELRDLVQQLTTDNQRLLEVQTTPIRTESSNVVPDVPRTLIQPNGSYDHFVYVPRERKCPIFRGTLGIGIAEWVEEVRASMRARGLILVEQAYFIYDHLEGEAKNEIKYRPSVESEDPDKILSILLEMYGCPQSYVALQEEFFSRKQLEGESLQEYSHALFKLMNEVLESSPDAMPSSATLLRDKFVEHVIDPALRRALKQTVRAHPDFTLLDIRKEAIRWEQEGMSVEGRARSYSVPSMCATHVYNISNTSSTSNYSAEIAEISLGSSFPDCRILLNDPQCTTEGRLSAAVVRKLAPSESLSNGSGGDKFEVSHLKVSNLVGPCPSVMVLMSGVRVPCLLDTGSMVSTPPMYPACPKEWQQALQFCHSASPSVRPTTGIHLVDLSKAVLFKPLSNVVLPAGVLVVPAVVQVFKCTVYVPVLNVSDTDVRVPSRCALGTLKPAQIVSLPAGIVEVPCSLEATVSMQQVQVDKVKQLIKSVDLPTLSELEQSKVISLLTRYQSVFAIHEGDLGCTTLISHGIPLTDEVPIQQRYSRIPPAEYDAVKAHIHQLLESQVIRESCSPYASPIVLVKKKDGSLHLCVDYRQLNRKTRKYTFPLPRIEESLDALSGALWFSTLDLASGYNQVPVDEQDKSPLYHLIGELVGSKDRKGARRSLSSAWTEDCESSFQDLKVRLTTTPVLAYANFSLPFILEVDASQNGLGVVLSQQQEGRITPAASTTSPGSRTHSTATPTSVGRCIQRR